MSESFTEELKLQYQKASIDKLQKELRNLFNANLLALTKFLKTIYSCHKIILKILMSPDEISVSNQVRSMLSIMIRNLKKSYILIISYLQNRQVIVNFDALKKYVMKSQNKKIITNNTSISDKAFSQFLEMSVWLLKDLQLLLNLKKDHHQTNKIFLATVQFLSLTKDSMKKRKIRYQINQLQIKVLNMIFLYKSQQYQRGSQVCEKNITQIYEFLFYLTQKCQTKSNERLKKYKKGIKKAFKLLFISCVHQCYFHIFLNNFHSIQALVSVIKKIQTLPGPRQMIKYYQSYTQILQVFELVTKTHDQFQAYFGNGQIFTLNSIFNIIEAGEKTNLKTKYRIELKNSQSQNKCGTTLLKQALMSSTHLKDNQTINNQKWGYHRITQNTRVIQKNDQLIQSKNMSERKFISNFEQIDQKNQNIISKARKTRKKKSIFQNSETSQKYIAILTNQSQKNTTEKVLTNINDSQSHANIIFQQYPQNVQKQNNNDYIKLSLQNKVFRKKQVKKLNLPKQKIRYSDINFDANIRNRKFQLYRKKLQNKMPQFDEVDFEKFLNYKDENQVWDKELFLLTNNLENIQIDKKFQQQNKKVNYMTKNNNITLRQNFPSMKIQLKINQSHSYRNSRSLHLKQKYSIKQQSERYKIKQDILAKFYKVLIKNKVNLSISNFAFKIENHLKKIKNKNDEQKMITKKFFGGSQINLSKIFPELKMISSICAKTPQNNKKQVKKKLNVEKMSSCHIFRTNIIKEQKFLKSQQRSSHFGKNVNYMEIQNQKQQDQSNKEYSRHSLNMDSQSIDKFDQRVFKCYKKSQQSIQNLTKKLLKKEQNMSTRQDRRPNKFIRKSSSYFYS